MHITDTTDRWTEIRAVHREHHFLYQMLGGATLVALGILLGAAIFAQDSGYATNLYTEILSIAVTVFILNLLSERREEARRIRDLQEQLVRDAGSQSNEAAKRAIDELRDRGWLTGEGSLLKGENLSNAKLEEANLRYANLQNTILEGANLENTDLRQSNLQSATLKDAKLSQAHLQEANLYSAVMQDINLFEANLQMTNCSFATFKNADLWGADLKGANWSGATLEQTTFFHANLQGVTFRGAQFGANITLPDSAYWTPDTDMSRFTNPDHPDFWRSDDPDSPAYRGYNNVTGE